MRFTFTCTDDENEPHLTNTLQFEAVGWDVIANQLRQFLQGSGYSITEEQLAQHFATRSTPTFQFGPDSDTELDNHAARFGVDSPK